MWLALEMEELGQPTDTGKGKDTSSTLEPPEGCSRRAGRNAAACLACFLHYWEANR